MYKARIGASATVWYRLFWVKRLQIDAPTSDDLKVRGDKTGQVARDGSAVTPASSPA
jgi:hypothetical protein